MKYRVHIFLKGAIRSDMCLEDVIDTSFVGDGRMCVFYQSFDDGVSYSRVTYIPTDMIGRIEANRMSE